MKSYIRRKWVLLEYTLKPEAGKRKFFKDKNITNKATE